VKKYGSLWDDYKNIFGSLTFDLVKNCADFVVDIYIYDFRQGDVFYFPFFFFFLFFIFVSH